jgi:hypothetical protein
LLIGASVLFVYAHDYDLAALVPLAPALERRLRGRVQPTVAALALLLILFTPQRLLRSLDNPLVLQFRVPVVLLLLAGLLLLARPRRHEAAYAAASPAR